MSRNLLRNGTPVFSKATRRLMIVDDENKICSALRFSLRSEGYQLRFANSAQEALVRLQEEPADVVLSDHLMPSMTGLTFLKLLHDRYPDTVRILFTGHADMLTAIEAVNHGEIYRFLTKPWDDGELKATLHLAFQIVDLERENRWLLAEVRNQQRLLLQAGRSIPLPAPPRDERGAILIDDSADLEAC
jgi:two-component system, probable response regulator PhcQ